MDIRFPTSQHGAASSESKATDKTSAGHATESGERLPVGGNDKPEIAEPKEARKAAQNLQDFISSTGRQLQFRVDEQTGRTVITVINKQTQEIVRQIPEDEALKVIAAIRALGLNVVSELV